MNEEIHLYIVEKGLALLPPKIRKEWERGKKLMRETSMYPDKFADRSLIRDRKTLKYLEPEPPRASWYKKLVKKAKESSESSQMVVEEYVYLFAHYLRETINSLQRKDYREGSRFAGVFSHIIGDLLQPIHLLSPAIIDSIIPVPERYLGFELHAGIEGVSVYPEIEGYSPELLGSSFPRAVMGVYRKIKMAENKLRFTVIPIVQAIYSDDFKTARDLLKRSVESSVKVFADFLFTSWMLSQNENLNPSPLDLTEYPYVSSEVDMLYRYKPLRDISLIPYSGGRYYPLSLRGRKGEVLEVKGFGVIPYLGPQNPFLQKGVKKREARIDFFIYPGGYSNFKAKVGINPLFKESKGEVVFRVLSQDKLIYQTPPLSRESFFVEINIELPEKSHLLTLSMLTLKEPPPPLVKTHPHGVWAYPVLE